MKTIQNPFRFGFAALAIPLAITAAVSANQWISDHTPLQVSVDIESLDSTSSKVGVHRLHTIAVDNKGEVEGRVVSIAEQGSEGIAGLTVFFLREGKVVAETTTQEDGTFTIAGLSEGPYSFIATGDNGFAAYGIQVVGELQGSSNVLEAAAVAPDLASVKQILSNNLPTNVVDQLVVNSGKVLPNGANRVMLSEGNLKGSIHSLIGGDAAVRGATIHLLKENQKVKSVVADDSGSFRIGDVDPGVYGFVAVGPSGFAAISFEAIQEADGEIPVSTGTSVVEPIAQPIPGAEPIVYQDSMPVEIPVDMGTSGTYANSLDVCLTCGNSGYTDNSIAYDPGYTTDFAPVEYASESIGCGGACGATCGSCGNFSGFSSCCGAGGGLAGGRLGGLGGGRLGGLLRPGARLGRFGRLALLGGTIGGIIAIANGDDPDPATNPNPN